MTRRHKLVLYGSLGLLGASLIIPGVMVMLSLEVSHGGLFAEPPDGSNQLRALYGMMTGVGVVALWACLDLKQAHSLVTSLGIIMALGGVARCYSILVDGVPGLMTLLYLGVELLLAAIFLLWPPSKSYQSD